jgi:hypothetical protein
MRRKLGLGAMLSMCLAPTAPAFAEDVDLCGTLEKGVECLLLRTDDNQRYSVDDAGKFDAGHRVRIRGDLQTSCASVCQQGDGCLTVADITYCNGPIEACGELVSGVTWTLFEDDRGYLFAISNTGEFEVGDRVRVTGTFQGQCVSICQQTSGCIVDNTIRALTPLDVCPPPGEDRGVDCPLIGAGLLGAAAFGIIGLHGRGGRLPHA